jgi:DNA-binding NarL/FixJ family response regulator
MKPWRWNKLTGRERDVARLLVVRGMKRSAVGLELGVSRTRVNQIVEAMYRILDVSGLTQLAFEMGRHWREIAVERKGKRSRKGT